MNSDDATETDLVRVVLGDANVLYSRVLRDYLLYAADQEVISIVWSGRILEEVTRHLVANVAGFTEESGKRLVSGMNAAFPSAEVEATVEHYQRLRVDSLPDEDDRHVLAAAVAAEASVLCTANTKDFPGSVTSSLGVETMTPDALLCLLITEFEPQMLAAHASAVASMRGATDVRCPVAGRDRVGVPRSKAVAETGRVSPNVLATMWA
ncbi:MAG: PIN domain-containing protein [Actinomycetia bacterium]|nr:PIN domain-containing protein [Actinomycetes bacterium]